MPIGESYVITPNGADTASGGSIPPKPPSFVHEAIMAHLRRVFADLIARVQPVWGTVTAQSGPNLLVRRDQDTDAILVPHVAGRRWPNGTRVMMVPGPGNQYVVTGGLTVSTGAAEGVVGTLDIMPGAITSGLIGAGVIMGSNIAALTITGGNIANRTISGNKIVLATLTGAEISGESLQGGHFINRTITGSKLVEATIGSSELSGASVTLGHLASDARNRLDNAHGNASHAVSEIGGRTGTFPSGSIWSNLSNTRNRAESAHTRIDSLVGSINSLQSQVSSAAGRADSAHGRIDTLNNQFNNHQGPPAHHSNDPHPKTEPLGHTH